MDMPQCTGSDRVTMLQWEILSSRVIVSPIKTPSEMAMPQCKVIPQLSIHHKPSEKTNWLCLNAKRHPTKKLSSMSGVCPSVDIVTSENPSLIRGVYPSVNHHLNSPSIMLRGIISVQAQVLPMCEPSNTMCEVMASGWSSNTGRNVGQGNRVKEMKGN